MLLLFTITCYTVLDLLLKLETGITQFIINTVRRCNFDNRESPSVELSPQCLVHFFLTKWLRTLHTGLQVSHSLCTRTFHVNWPCSSKFGPDLRNPPCWVWEEYDLKIFIFVQLLNILHQVANHSDGIWYDMKMICLKYDFKLEEFNEIMN